MRETAPPSWMPPVTAVLLVAVAWAFLPIANLPSFDAVKLALLVPCLAVATFLAARGRRAGTAEVRLLDPLILVPAVVALAAAVAAVAAWPRGSLLGPTLAIACVAAARGVRDGEPGVRWTLRAACAAAAGAGLYALVQRLGLDPAPWGARREVVATFGNTSFAAEFQAAALPMAAALALRPVASDAARAVGPESVGAGAPPRPTGPSLSAKVRGVSSTDRGDRILGALAAVLAATHLVLARSRIDFAAAAAAALVVAVCVVRDRRRARWIAGAGAAAAVAFAGLFAASAAGAVSWLGRSDTLRVRVLVWEGALRLFGDAPFRFGTAPFVDLFPPVRDPEEYRISLGRVVDTPHSDPLEIATTLGVAGVVAAAIVVALLAARLRALRRERPWETAALAGSLAATCVSGLASSPLTHPATALLAALAIGHVVALSPRPLRLRLPHRLPQRGVDGALAATLVLASWPGPALRTLVSDPWVAIGISERVAGRDEIAARALDFACAADPQAYAARFELGTLLLTQGEAAAAVAALESAHAIRPNDPECRTNLVHALREAERDGDADRLLDASLALVPWHPLLLAARAARSTARGDHAAARDDLVRAAALRPFDVRVRAVEAEARLGAEADEPSRTAALDLLVEIHAGGDTRLLTRATRAFVARDPVFLAVLATRARRISAQHPDVAAALVLAPIRGLVPDDAGYVDAAAEVLRTAGRQADAVRMAGRARGLRARAALGRGDADTARRLAAQAADRDPLPEHRVTEALALARLGERRAVREALATALALGPVDSSVLRADAAFAALLPDAALEALLDRADGLEKR